jgi:hypothetical protein
MELLIVALVVFIAIIWLYQFIQLMLLADSDFPGKCDKILWVVAFVCVPLLAPFAFMYWKKAYLSLRTEERQQRNSDAT